MSQEVEIYKQVVKVIDEENDRKIDVKRNRDGFSIEVTQIFRRDTSIPAAKLLISSGFDSGDLIEGGSYQGDTRHQVTPDLTFLVTATTVNLISFMLQVEWHFTDAADLRDGIRALNRVFNMFKSKLEEQ